MKLGYRQRPSLGFVLLALLAMVAIAGLAWAMRTPRLERVWRIDAELSLGHRPPLSRGERRLLQASLTRHPEIGSSLVEDRPHGIFSAHDDGRVDGDYAYLVRVNAESPGHLEVLYAGADGDGSVAVKARTASERTEGAAHPAAPFHWRLPDDGPFPQLIEVLLSAGEGQENRQPVRPRLRNAP